MSRSRRSRRSRRNQPSPRRPVPMTEAQLNPDDTSRLAARRRSVITSYPHIGGEILRVAGVSLASFGLLLLLIVVDRLR